MIAFWDHLGYEFFQRTLMACLLVGAVCALFSTYVVLRRLVFAAVALTQLASGGLGLAALTGLPPLPTSLATTILGVGLLGVVKPSQKVRTDNLIALLYIGGWAASVLLFAAAERGDTELAAILYGDILGVLPGDIYAFLPVAALVAALLLWLNKELLFVSFDPETAATCRIPVWLYDTFLFATLGVIIVFATKMLGLLLVFAFLVAPGTATLMFCPRMPSATVFAVVFSAAMSVLGLAGAAQWDLPPGPAVAACGLLLLGVLAVARRGLTLLVHRRAGAPQFRVDPEPFRVVAVVAALAAVAALAGALSGRVGSVRSDALLQNQHLQAITSARPTSGTPASAGAERRLPAGQVAEPAVQYRTTVGNALPDIQQLLNPPPD